MNNRYTNDIAFRIGANAKLWLISLAMLAMLIPAIATARSYRAKMQWLLIGSAFSAIAMIDRHQAFSLRMRHNDESAIGRTVHRQQVYTELMKEPQQAIASGTGAFASDQLPDEYEHFEIADAFRKPDYPHYMLVAPSGSGKTTTLRWLLDIAKTMGSTTKVLTPHIMDDEFAGHDVVTDKSQIYWAIYELHKEMVHRYEQKPWAKYMDNYEHITFAIDEAVSLFMDFKAMDKTEGGDVAKKWVQLLVEARKVKIRLIVATQSNRVDAIGLRGRGDIRDCLTRILLGKSAKARLSLLKRRKHWDDAKVEWVQSHKWFAIVEDADCHLPLFIPNLS